MKIYLFDMDDTIYVHDKELNYDNITEDRHLSALLYYCPYPKYIYTNATFGHADIILQRMKLSNRFKKIYSRDNIPSMKPDINSAIALEKDIIKEYNENNEYVFFDDLLVNLKSAKQRKWTTVWISPLHERKNNYPFIDYAFSDIKSALSFLQ